MIPAVDVALGTLASVVDWLRRNGVRPERIRSTVERALRMESDGNQA